MAQQSLQFVGETITENDIKPMCSLLDKNLVKILSWRDCEVSDKDFKKLMRSVAKCQSLLQLALNIGIINSEFRVQLLAQAINRNQSITGLFIHGSIIGNEGMKILCKNILNAGRLATLDVGDCHLGDAAVPHICQLLTPNQEWPGLLDLSMSANTNITHTGWAELSLALATSTLRSLYLDYNKLGDQTAACIVVGVAGCGTLEVIDMEGTSVTQKTAKLILNLVENYAVRLKKVSLSGNKVLKATVEAIKFCLRDMMEETDEAEACDSDLISITTRSSLDCPKQTPVKMVMSSGEMEIGNDTDQTIQDYSLHSEVVEQPDLKASSASVIENEQTSADNKVVEEDEEEFDDDIKEVPVYYTGIPVTF
ncbi:hypothetical protein SNE40_008994 [Patella caerulea]|uniref:Uncharacterized protein n=1 Tax=Patella caerulea TaxID=87958 RepID=A0AAN8JT42_PATCE